MSKEVLTDTERARISSKYKFPPEGSFAHAVLQMEIARVIEYETKIKRKKKSGVPVKVTEKVEHISEEKWKSSREKPVDPAEVKNDAESVENLSVSSISSVHTSELSDFDDEISIPSDKEMGFKRQKVPLSKIQALYKGGRVAEFCAANLKSKTRT